MSEGTWTMGRVDAGAGAFPSKTDNFQRATSGTAAGTAGISISTKPGRFYRAVVQNGAATAYFVQIFDKSTAAVNADVPVWQERMAVSSECKIDLTNVNGLPVVNGISLAISTTAGSLTLPLSTDIAFRSVIFTASQ